MICVDNCFFPGKAGRHTSRWCHLFTDQPEDPAELAELHRFAGVIGMKREWFQQHPTVPHYDVTEGMRSKAIAFGAVEVNHAKTAEVLERMRNRLLDAMKGD
jgi:hypothetical protein